jgi:hypothetical protein
MKNKTRLFAALVAILALLSTATLTSVVSASEGRSMEESSIEVGRRKYGSK